MFQPTLVDMRPDDGDLPDGVEKERRVVSADGKQDVDDRGLLEGVQPARGAEVEQPDAPPATT